MKRLNGAGFMLAYAYVRFFVKENAFLCIAVVGSGAPDSFQQDY